MSRLNSEIHRHAEAPWTLRIHGASALRGFRSLRLLLGWVFGLPRSGEMLRSTEGLTEG